MKLEFVIGNTDYVHLGVIDMSFYRFKSKIARQNRSHFNFEMRHGNNISLILIES